MNADPDPDPATQINADPCGSGYGSETLPQKNDATRITKANEGVGELGPRKGL